MPKWKTVMTVALVLYCLGLVFFSLYPPHSDRHWAEWLGVIGGVIGLLLLLAYASPVFRLPGENFAFLLVGWLGFSATLLYLIETVDEPGRRAGIALFLLSGSVAGYGAFLAEGHVDRSGRG